MKPTQQLVVTVGIVATQRQGKRHFAQGMTEEMRAQDQDVVSVCDAGWSMRPRRKRERMLEVSR